jgi:hypothetical protein
MSETVTGAVQRVERALERAESFGIVRTLFGREGPGLVMADLSTLLAEHEAMREALEFYRDAWEWVAVGDEGDGVTEFPRVTGYEGEPNAALLKDQGHRADAALRRAIS